jgi:hypothetical protein
MTNAKIKAIQSGSLVDWTNEAHVAAQQTAYPDVHKNSQLAAPYYNNTKPVVDEQLKRAGYRLAKVLDDLFNK